MIWSMCLFHNEPSSNCIRYDIVQWSRYNTRSQPYWKTNHNWMCDAKLYPHKCPSCCLPVSLIFEICNVGLTSSMLHSQICRLVESMILEMCTANVFHTASGLWSHCCVNHTSVCNLYIWLDIFCRMWSATNGLLSCGSFHLHYFGPVWIVIYNYWKSYVQGTG